MVTKTLRNSVLRLQQVKHVPEIQLYLCDDPPRIRAVNHRFDCWPYVWAGGLALARYILDNKEIVNGKTVVDLASGCGIVAIAAKLAGATSVTAVDDYEPCMESIALNAKANCVNVLTQQCDLFKYRGQCDLFLMGDPFLNKEVFPYVKANFDRVLVGCPIRMPHYTSYMTDIIETYHMDVLFDEYTEYDSHIWWLG